MREVKLRRTAKRRREAKRRLVARMNWRREARRRKEARRMTVSMRIIFRGETQNLGREGQERLIRLSKMSEILASTRTMLLKQRQTHRGLPKLSIEECLEHLENETRDSDDYQEIAKMR